MSTGDVRRAVEQKPVVVVGQRGCCMVHVARRLLLGQGGNPAVLEVGDGTDPATLVAALRSEDITTKGVVDVVVDACGLAAAFPVVFIGGKLVGGLDRLMAMHIAGELMPVLKQAGALWSEEPCFSDQSSTLDDPCHPSP
ncbi:hypothetical protein ACQ4PT_047495 [Festuca glaucescens]